MVRLLLKKAELDASQLKSYRPVSNLPFLSELLERVVQKRLYVFSDSSDLMPRSQSAYSQYHNTKTAVTKIYNDMLLPADNRQVTGLCLLDFTTAFNTVDHRLLMLRLERQFGIYGIALEWFRSYLQGTSFRVIYPVDYDSRCLLCATRIGSRSPSLHFVQDGPCRSQSINQSQSKYF